jgi:hypothetical protein
MTLVRGNQVTSADLGLLEDGRANDPNTFDWPEKDSLMLAFLARLVRHRTDTDQHAIVFIGQCVQQSVRALADVFEALMQTLQ